MQERLLVELRENDSRIDVDLASRSGVVLRGEFDAFPRRINIGLVPHGEAMKSRVRRLSQVKGWPLHEWRLNISADRGCIALSGAESDGLLDGLYKLRVDIEDLKIVGRKAVSIEIPKTGTCKVQVNVRRDKRCVQLAAPVRDFDQHVKRILLADESVLDQRPAAAWLTSTEPRPVRQACLLNILAMTRTTPLKTNHLARHVLNVFFAATDRIYVRVEPAFLTRLRQLAGSPGKRFYDEGEPTGDVHVKLLHRIEDDRRVKPDTYRLLSFRAEGAPSLQAIVACPKDGVGGAYHYADLDLDLGNPRQDLIGFLVHMGELLNPDRTDHFSLHRKLARTKVQKFLYYKIRERSINSSQPEGEETR